MGRPRIVEANFYEFKMALRRAGDVGGRIEKKQKEECLTALFQNPMSLKNFFTPSSHPCECGLCLSPLPASVSSSSLISSF